MPKLSQQTLEKRVLCSHCGKTFKGLQGLSGHIQFKHSSKNEPPEKSVAEKVVEFAEYKSILLAGGFSQAESMELTYILADWDNIKSLLKLRNLSTDKRDLKDFLIMAYSNMYSNRRLKAELAKYINAAVVKITNNT